MLIAPNIAVLGALRVLQGIGTAAAAVIALAIVRDLYEGRAAATMLSRLFLVMGVAPVLAPTFGGELLRFTSWRGSSPSWRSTACSCSPSVPSACARPCRPSAVAPAEWRPRSGPTADCSATRTYVGLILVAGLTMAALFTYVSGSSFVYQQQFGLDEQQFGMLFGAGAFWLISATQLDPVLLRWWSPARSWSPARWAERSRVACSSCWPPWVRAVCSASPCRCGRSSSPRASRCPTPRRSPWPLRRVGRRGGGTARRDPVRGRCRGVTLVGLLGNDALAMGLVIVAALLLAVVVLVAVVRPWALPETQDGPAPAFAH